MPLLIPLQGTVFDAIGLPSFVNKQLLTNWFEPRGLDSAIQMSTLTFAQTFALNFLSKNSLSGYLAEIEEVVRREFLFGKVSFIQSFTRLQKYLHVSLINGRTFKIHQD